MRRADTSSLRSHNSQLLLRLVRDLQPASARALTEHTGMQASTVSRLLRELSSRNLVHSLGSNSGGKVGRRAELWGLKGAAGASVGLYLASDMVAGVAMDLSGQLLANCVIPFRDPESQTPESLLALMGDALSRLSRSPRVAACPMIGVGVATLGLVDQSRASFKYFQATVDVGALRDGNTWPLHLENDANAVARGAAMQGALAGVRDAIVLYAHEGIGAGLIINGALHRGRGGAAGEVGYRGTQLVSNPLDGDEPALHERFHRGVCSLLNLVNPEVLLLTGDLSTLPPSFLETLRARIATETNPIARQARLAVEPCDPMEVARHMAAIVLEEEIFSAPTLMAAAASPATKESP